MIKLPTITDKEAKEYVEEKKKYDEIISRMMEVTESKDEFELADYLCIRASELSSNMRDLIIPTDWIKKLAAGKGIAPSWLLTGEGNKKL